MHIKRYMREDSYQPACSPPKTWVTLLCYIGITHMHRHHDLAVAAERVSALNISEQNLLHFHSLCVVHLAYYLT